MASTAFPVVADDYRQGAGFRRTATRLVRGAMEAGVLILVCLSPWAFGAVEPEHEFLLDVGVAVLTTLWGARMLLDGQLSWRKCPVAVCVTAWVLLGVWQVIPLPGGLLGRISPATVRMYDRLLPAQPEVLPFGEPRGTSIVPAGSTLSFYPGATRRETFRYLAILLLFAVVRNNIASSASLRRLGIAVFVNGSLLALFGLIQAFSSDPQTIYWAYPAPGATGVFGPFINRNHFAFYMNVCVGLGAGLLLGRYAGRGRTRGGEGPTPAGTLGTRAHASAGDGLALSLDPVALGMISALALMISSVVSSLSRGGFLALLCSSILGLVTWRLRSRWSTRGGIVVPTLVIALALVSWFGYDRVVTRLATFQDGLVSRGGRLAAWSRALPPVRDFPLWGTGYGTYQFIDILNRNDAFDANTINDHAHNDYLEALVEGGLAQLVPVVVAVVLVFRLGFRAIHRQEDRPVGGLVLGALVGFTAAAIHSFSDFGLHIPANAAIVTVLCAQLCAAGHGRGGAGPEPAADREADDSDRYVLRLRGLAPTLGAASVVALGLALACEGLRAHRAQQLRLAAFDLEASPDPAIRDQKAAYLEAATRLVPGYARLQADLAHVHLGIFERRMAELTAGGPRGARAGAGLTTDRDGRGGVEEGQLTHEHLVPALRHFLRSRDLCPLRAEAHMEIADHVDQLEVAEPRIAYLERAKLLCPDDPELWNRCGIQEIADGRPDRAWASWRRSLELSDSLLPEILDRSAAHLGPRDIMCRVLPDRPGLLLKAALYLYPQPEEGRRPFLEGALAILEGRPDSPGAADLHVKASIHRALGQSAEAMTAYRAALDLEPLQLAWRHELAELSYEQGQFQESFQELLKIKMMQPEDARARELLDAVNRKIAEGR
jgi:O-antigen ligase/tetratricopeptide (TPR) repeat protein